MPRVRRLRRKKKNITRCSTTSNASNVERQTNRASLCSAAMKSAHEGRTFRVWECRASRKETGFASQNVRKRKL